MGRRVEQGLVVGLMGCLVVGTACGLLFEEDPAESWYANPNDSELCLEDADCDSGECLEDAVCGHSACETERDCREGWICVEEEVGSNHPWLDVLFGTTTFGTCMIHCDTGCPEHYECDLEGSDFCVPDWGWSRPLVDVTWTGAATGSSDDPATLQPDVAAGEPVFFEATVTSPSGAGITTWAWTLTSVTNAGTDEQATEESTVEDVQSLEVTVPEGVDQVRVHLGVEDQTGRLGSAPTITLRACRESGLACADDPGPCCNGCDTDAGICF